MAQTISGPLSAYDPDGFFCEMLGGRGDAADHTRAIRERLNRLDLEDLRGRARDAELELYSFGITFTVYTQKDVIDRILPFDVIPRVLSANAWDKIERGVTQRVTALNLFLRDIYHDQKVLKDGVIPRDLVLGNKNYCAQMEGIDVPFGTYVHINGTDLVRGDDEEADKRTAFYDEYLAVMDLPAEFYLQTIKTVFKDHALPKGEMIHRWHPVKPENITRSAILCVEGELDDISGVGQTRAVLDLATSLPDEMKKYHLQKNVGHYGIFNGGRWRREIAPVVKSFIREHDHKLGKRKARLKAVG